MVFFALLFIACISLYLIIRMMSPSRIVPIVRTFGITKPEVIGFQPYWLVGSGNQSYAKDITTLTYFSLAVEKDGTIRHEDKPGELEPGWRMIESDTYAATLSAHRKAGVKLSLLVQNMVEDDILELIKEPVLHGTKLVEEVAPIMQKHGFSDLNLDIESFTKASESARLQYAQFVEAVKNELTRQKLGTLTVELTPKSPVEMHLIDVARIGQIADYVVLMAYDYHYVFSTVAGPVAPIGGVPTVVEYDVETALKETLRYAPASKVMLGIPLYGYEWETIGQTPGAPVIPGSWQLATGKRIEEFIKTCTDCTRGFDPISQEPYVVFPGETPGHFQQVFYENKDALQAKIKLAEKYQLAGVAMWAVGYESEGMLAPVQPYKNSVQYRGFGVTPTPDYIQIQPASLTLFPPTHALVGSISTMSGVIQRMGRQDEEYRILEIAEPVVQGESYACGSDGTADIQFPNLFSLHMDPTSELSFSELVPPNIALRQKGGRISYRLLQKDAPIFVRVLRSLIELTDGEMDVATDGSRATVTVNNGSAKIGNIDTTNTTTTFMLSTGQQASINETSQTVRVD